MLYKCFVIAGPWAKNTVRHPVDTSRWHNVVLMLVHRPRRWPNIKTTLCQRLVFATDHFYAYMISK